jgi:hypothetical protein
MITRRTPPQAPRCASCGSATVRRLKLPYCVADGGGGNLQPLGRGTKTQALGYERKGVQVRKGAALH